MQILFGKIEDNEIGNATIFLNIGKSGERFAKCFRKCGVRRSNFPKPCSQKLQ